MQGCCLLIVLLFIIGGCAVVMSDDSDDQWCRDTEAFWAQNPGDSNPKLARAYAMQCQ